MEYVLVKSCALFLGSSSCYARLRNQEFILELAKGFEPPTL
jgi:hypothetical protein